MNKDDREKIAAAVHDSWAHWMAHLFRKCEPSPDGRMTIPQELVKRWKRQIDTPYAELSLTEQQSDLKQADRILEAVGKRAVGMRNEQSK